jgi:hypothetical protein
MAESFSVERQSARFHLHSDVDLEMLRDPEYLLDGYIEERAVTVFYGPSGCGKTFAVLGAALSIATGRTWHGKAVRQRPVIYVVGEGTHGIKKRVKAWKQHHGIEVADRAFFVLGPVQLMSPGDVDAFLAQVAVRDIKPGLIVFDTLATCFVGGDENSAQDMGRVVDAVRRIQRGTGATVILVHHTGKPKESGRTSERGSSALRAAADAMIRVESVGARIHLTTDKLKDDAPADALIMVLKVITLGIKGNGKPLTSCVLEPVDQSADSQAANDLGAEHLEALGALCSAGRVKVKTADWLKAFSLSAETLNRRRRWLEEHGYVTKVAKGIYSLTTIGQLSTMSQCRVCLVGAVRNASALCRLPPVREHSVLFDVDAHGAALLRSPSRRGNLNIPQQARPRRLIAGWRLYSLPIACNALSAVVTP